LRRGVSMSTIIAIATVGYCSIMRMIIICIWTFTVISIVHMVVKMIIIVALLCMNISIYHGMVVWRCAADSFLIHIVQLLTYVTLSY
jgi:hypothetical protein